MTKLRVIKHLDKYSSEHGMDDPDLVEFYAKLTGKEKSVYCRIAERALAAKPDAKDIADIGTGPGLVAIELAKLTGHKVKAVDLSPNMLKKADKIAASAGVEIETIESSGEELKIESKSIDLLTAVNFIDSLKDPVPSIKEFKRVMKEGGVVFISGFKRDVLAPIRWLGYFQSNVLYKNKPLGGLGAVIDVAFTKSELESFFAEAGLRDFTITTGIFFLEATIRL